MLACGRAIRRPAEPLPAPALANGQLHISVVYPRVSDSSEIRGDTTFLVAREDQVITSRDSAFIFGSVGRGDAALEVNGIAVDVYPTGGWIAWLRLSEDSVQTFRITTYSDTDTVFVQLSVPLLPYFQEPAAGPWIDTTTFSPVGDMWVRRNEDVTLSVTAVGGADVFLMMSDSVLVPMLPELVGEERSSGRIAFGTEAVRQPRTASARSRYRALISGPLGPDPGPILGTVPDSAADDSTWIRVLVVQGADSATANWPLRLGVLPDSPPTIVVINDDPDGTGDTDAMSPGRPSPFGTYHWFFPNGTVAEVSGRWGSQTRLRLSGSTVSWVNTVDLQLLAPGTPPLRGTTRPIRLTPGEKSLALRIPLPGRIPYRIDESERELQLTLYGVAADMDWIQYGRTDPLISLVSFSQPTADETVVSVKMTEGVWGYRSRWEGSDLVVEIRRPPPIRSGNPLRGRLIVLDPGHPPGGSIGPTGVTEWDVVLDVALAAKTILEGRGASVLLTRRDSVPLGLRDRTALAERVNADVLVSIHANALPDGVNPFENNGTSVYYFHPRSAPLARALDQALTAQFGSRDLGIGRGDLALARPTWMPAVLTEGLFMMLPDQEAVLASPEGQQRYARGIADGLETFLRNYAR